MIRRRVLPYTLGLLLLTGCDTTAPTPDARPSDAYAAQACQLNARAQTDRTADQPMLMGIVADSASQAAAEPVRETGAALAREASTVAATGGQDQAAISALVAASYRLHQACVDLGLAPTGG